MHSGPTFISITATFWTETLLTVQKLLGPKNIRKLFCHINHITIFTNHSLKVQCLNDRPDLSTFAPIQANRFSRILHQLLYFTQCHNILVTFHCHNTLSFVHNSLMWVGGCRCNIKCLHCWNTCCNVAWWMVMMKWESIVSEGAMNPTIGVFIFIGTWS